MFEFVNQESCLKFSSVNGAISGMTAYGKELMTGAERAFRIRLLAGNGDTVMLDDRDFSDFSFDGKNILHWRDCRKFAGLEAALEIRCAGNDTFCFRPQVSGIPEGFLLELISAPLIGIAIDSDLLIPHYEGALWQYADAVEKSWEEHFEFPGNCQYYPGALQMQFFAATRENSGIYCAADDLSHALKFIGSTHQAGAKSLEVYMECLCGTENPGKNYTLPYDIILRPFTGNWQHACEIYREWAERDPVLQRDFELPKWMDESPVVIICPVRGGKSMSKDTNAFVPYENTFPRIRELAEKFNSKVMVLLMRWDHHGPWLPPYYWPPAGGVESFRKFRDLLHGDGHLFGVYGSGTFFTIKSLKNDYSGEEIFKRENLAPSMITGPHGEMEDTYSAIRVNTSFCVAEKKGRQIIAEETRILADEKVDFFQILDQNLGGASFPCYSRKHHHPAIPGSAGTYAMKDFLRELNEMIRSRGSNMLLGTECAAAMPFIAELPFNDLRAHGVETDDSSPVPAYQFVFHRHLNNFFGNSCTVPNHTDNDCMRFRMARGFCDGSMLTVVLRDNGEIDWGSAVCEWSKPAPDQHSIITLVRNLNEARRDHRDFLQHGDMLPAPHIKCGTKDFSTLVLSGKVKTVPEILCSAWRAPDGRKAAFFVNYQTEEKTFIRNGESFTVPPLNVIMLEDKK